MTTKTKLMILLGTLALFGVITLYVLEFQWFQNSFEVGRLVFGALVFGLILGIALGLVLRKKLSEMDEKLQRWAMCLVLPMLFMPLLANMANRLFAKPAKTIPVVFWEQKAYLKSRYGQLKGQKMEASGYFTFVIKDGTMVRLDSRLPKFPDAMRGDTVELAVREGLFGVAFVVLD